MQVPLGLRGGSGTGRRGRWCRPRGSAQRARRSAGTSVREGGVAGAVRAAGERTRRQGKTEIALASRPHASYGPPGGSPVHLNTSSEAAGGQSHAPEGAPRRATRGPRGRRTTTVGQGAGRDLRGSFPPPAHAPHV